MDRITLGSVGAILACVSGIIGVFLFSLIWLGAAIVLAIFSIELLRE